MIPDLKKIRKMDSSKKIIPSQSIAIILQIPMANNI
jgi:hypothetical protein